MENNNLDKLFRDKLKDLKVSAPEDTWEAIAEKLPRKKKRRALVLWWSAAAVLLILLSSSVLYLFMSDAPSKNTQLVETEKKSEIPTKSSTETTASETLTENSPKNTLATEGKELKSTDKTKLQDKRSTDNKYNTRSEFDTTKNKAIADKSDVQDKTIASQETQRRKSKSDTTSESEQSVIQKQKDKNATLSKDKETLYANEYPSINETKNKQNLVEKQIAQAKDLNKEDEEKIEEEQEVDTLLNNTTLLAEEENIQEETKDKQGKWSVGPQVAPVYYNSMSTGSSLDSQFNNSGNKGGVNMSLGLQVAYQLNDNWQVRSGVHQMNVGYATNNVQVGYSDPNLAIANINYNDASAGDIVVTAFSNENLTDLYSANLGNKVEVLNMEGNTQLKQNITYLEVPIEIERKLIQSDFEWTIIGGVSSLFLTENDVYVHNKDYSHQLGSATNLEKTSFTTNIGMGFGYNFTKHLHLKLEPMFKYQLNAYTNSVDFKPYMFGVYTGINWKLD